MKYKFYHSLSNSLLYHEWPAHFHHIYYLPGGCDQHTKRGREETPHPRSGAEAGRTPCPKGGSQEELPHVRGQVQRPRVPDCHGAGMAKRSYPVSEVRRGSQRRYPASEVRGGDKRSYPASEVRGHGREEIPHSPSPRPGAAGRRSYLTPPPQGQGRRLGGPTPRPRSPGCRGVGGPRQPTPVLLPGKSHEQRDLVGCSPWGR